MVSPPIPPIARYPETNTRDVDMLQPVIDALKAHRAQQAAMRLKRGGGKPEAGKDYEFTGPEGGFLNLNYHREKNWYATLAGAKLRRRTFYQTRAPSQAMRSPLVRIRNGWLICSTTSLRRSCSTCTRSLFRGGRATMEVR